MLIRRFFDAGIKGLCSLVVFFRCKDKETSRIVFTGAVRVFVSLKTDNLFTIFYNQQHASTYSV